MLNAVEEMWNMIKYAVATLFQEVFALKTEQERQRISMRAVVADMMVLRDMLQELELGCRRLERDVDVCKSRDRDQDFVGLICGEGTKRTRVHAVPDLDCV